MTRKSRSSDMPPTDRMGALTAVVFALLLAGCSTTGPYGVDLGDYQTPPRDLIGVQSRTYSHDVRLGSTAGSIGPTERERLDAFISATAGNRPESLRVTLRGRASNAQLQQVNEQLIADGVVPRHIVRADPRHAPAVRSGTIVVAVERAVAIRPHCPGWLPHPAAPEDNQTNPNFGCSDASNFAAMVGDPHHLTQPASSIYSDGARATLAIDTYRTDKLYDDKWSKELPRARTSFEVIPSGGGK